MITKIIHQIWIQGKLPLKFQDNEDILVRNNPTCKYILWNDEMIQNLIKTHVPDMLETYQSGCLPVIKADIGRHIILYVMG